MATIKSYTDISQSKKLSEILPLESADMEYLAIKENGVLVGAVPFVKDDSEVEDSAYSHIYDRIACWSLTALLGVLPDELKDNDFLTLQKEKNEYCCCYEDINGNSFRHTFANNPIDACVAMIENLHELRVL
jgi:hypothetical protein